MWYIYSVIPTPPWSLKDMSRVASLWRGFLAKRSRKKSSVRKVPKFPSMFNTASSEAELRTDLEEKRVSDSRTNIWQPYLTNTWKVLNGWSYWAWSPHRTWAEGTPNFETRIAYSARSHCLIIKIYQNGHQSKSSHPISPADPPSEEQRQQRDRSQTRRGVEHWELWGRRQWWRGWTVDPAARQLPLAARRPRGRSYEECMKKMIHTDTSYVHVPYFPHPKFVRHLL